MPMSARRNRVGTNGLQHTPARIARISSSTRVLALGGMLIKVAIHGLRRRRQHRRRVAGEQRRFPQIGADDQRETSRRAGPRRVDRVLGSKSTPYVNPCARVGDEATLASCNCPAARRNSR